MLEARDVVKSKSRRSNYYDNAVAESLFGSLKASGPTTKPTRLGGRPSVQSSSTWKRSTTVSDTTRPWATAAQVSSSPPPDHNHPRPPIVGKVKYQKVLSTLAPECARATPITADRASNTLLERLARTSASGNHAAS